jgi:transcriptional regulator with XRE-family HTH domain
VTRTRDPVQRTIVVFMSSTVDTTLGQLLGTARASLGDSLQVVAERAGCSSAYVHKLEQDRVHTPSPRVLAGLARTLGLQYDVLMSAAGYDGTPQDEKRTQPTIPRFSNEHIVNVLEQLVSEVGELKESVAQLSLRK